MLMESKLRENDDRPGWKADEPIALVRRVEEEADELRRAVNDLDVIVWASARSYGDRRGNGWSRLHPVSRERQVGVGYAPLEGDERQAALAAIVREAADVANMAMMVADVCGGLASRMSASGQAAQRLEAKPASPTGDSRGRPTPSGSEA